jgi:hypothetical protein
MLPADWPAWQTLWLYLLIEHQSEPDYLMPLRLADYELRIFKQQVREWEKTHPKREKVRLQPVLPVVLYMGISRKKEGKKEGEVRARPQVLPIRKRSRT